MLEDEQFKLMERAKGTAAATGWKVFPVKVYPDPEKPGKHKKQPLLVDWRAMAAVTKEDIESLEWDHATHFGVVCGDRVGAWVVDVDDLTAGETLNLPDTLTQRTISGGIHKIYRNTNTLDQRDTYNNPAKGIDIRANGGFIVWYEEKIPKLDDLAPWPFKEVIRASGSNTKVDLSQLGDTIYTEPGRNEGLFREISSYIGRHPTIDPETLYLAAQGLNVRHCSPPLPDKELRDTILKTTPRYLQEQIDPTEPIFKMLSLDDLRKRGTNEYVIKGILPKGGLGMLFGASTAGKTFVAVDWMCRIATGMPIAGHQTKKKKILYLCLEGSHSIINRIDGTLKELGITNLPKDQIKVVEVIPSDLFHSEELAERAKAELLSVGMDDPLIVIDTLAAANPGQDENQTAVATEFVDCAQRLPGTKIILHHEGKHTKGDRGSTAYKAACDMQMHIIGTDKRRKIKATKIKDAECNFEMDFRITQHILDRFDEDGVPISGGAIQAFDDVEEETKKRKLTAAQIVLKQKVVELLGITPVMEIRQLAKAIKPKDPTREVGRIEKLVEMGEFIGVEEFDTMMIKLCPTAPLP